MDISTLFLYFLFYSVVGWIYESIYCSIMEKRLISRGFLNGPLCPIYGVGAVVDILILGDIGNPIVLFLTGAAVASILEYVISWGLEKVFHARWWDYNNMRFNLNGRVCLLGATAFGTGTVILILFLHPAVVRLISLIPPAWLPSIEIACATLLVFDIVVTVMSILKLNEKLQHVVETASAGLKEIKGRSEALTEKIAENTIDSEAYRQWREELRMKNNEHVQTLLNTLGILELRMIKSYPQLQLKDQRNDLLQALKEKLNIKENIKNAIKKNS